MEMVYVQECQSEHEVCGSCSCVVGHGCPESCEAVIPDCKNQCGDAAQPDSAFCSGQCEYAFDHPDECEICGEDASEGKYKPYCSAECESVQE